MAVIFLPSFSLYSICGIERMSDVEALESVRNVLPGNFPRAYVGASVLRCVGEQQFCLSVYCKSVCTFQVERFQMKSRVFAEQSTRCPRHPRSSRGSVASPCPRVYLPAVWVFHNSIASKQISPLLTTFFSRDFMHVKKAAVQK